MKTKIYFTSLLSLCIGMTLIGQNNPSTSLTPAEQYASNDTKKILATLAGSGATIADYRAVSTSGETTKTAVASVAALELLLKQADDLIYVSGKMRIEAKTKTDHEKNTLISVASNYEKKALFKQIEALEMAGELNLKKFKENKVLINTLVKNWEVEETIQSHTKFLMSSSDKNMKLALEMREEAKSLKSPASMAGTMGNAEEKEILALSEQDQIIGQLDKNFRTKRN